MDLFSQITIFTGKYQSLLMDEGGTETKKAASKGSL
jgi:hypothetical protein